MHILLINYYCKKVLLQAPLTKECQTAFFISTQMSSYRKVAAEGLLEFLIETFQPTI
jgi:hypothetical protein